LRSRYDGRPWLLLLIHHGARVETGARAIGRRVASGRGVLVRRASARGAGRAERARDRSARVGRTVDRSARKARRLAGSGGSRTAHRSDRGHRGGTRARERVATGAPVHQQGAVVAARRLRVGRVGGRVVETRLRRAGRTARRMGVGRGVEERPVGRVGTVPAPLVANGRRESVALETKDGGGRVDAMAVRCAGTSPRPVEPVAAAATGAVDRPAAAGLRLAGRRAGAATGVAGRPVAGRPAAGRPVVVIAAGPQFAVNAGMVRRPPATGAVRRPVVGARQRTRGAAGRIGRRASDAPLARPLLRVRIGNVATSGVAVPAVSVSTAALATTAVVVVRTPRTLRPSALATPIGPVTAQVRGAPSARARGAGPAAPGGSGAAAISSVVGMRSSSAGGRRTRVAPSATRRGRPRRAGPGLVTPRARPPGRIRVATATGR
jgi:hypothetical protein